MDTNEIVEQCTDDFIRAMNEIENNLFLGTIDEEEATRQIAELLGLE